MIDRTIQFLSQMKKGQTALVYCQGRFIRLKVLDTNYKTTNGAKMDFIGIDEAEELINPKTVR